jgi:23S rRNA (adenine2503-C2)-methyltransferase
MELSYIDHFDNKDSLCVPTQSGCRMACKFCHTREALGKMPTTNLWSGDIVTGVKAVATDLGLVERPRTLLVSFMGCGEPLENDVEMLQAIRGLRNLKPYEVAPIRFSMATMMPKGSVENFVHIGDAVRGEKIPLKVHLSLHFTNNELRRKWMPQAEAILPSINMLEWYKNYTGNPVEIHYTLIEGVNDTNKDAYTLSSLLNARGIPIKFLRFNPKVGQPYKPSSLERAQQFQALMLDSGYEFTMECYTSPGFDIGASCGMFTMDYYIKYAHGTVLTGEE